MNKQELIERIEGLKNIFWNECEYVKIDFMLELVSELDEPEAGHADEAPRYVKNILARLRELPLHDREVWLKTIMGEFEQDFSRAKWREGYEQGKVEGLIEREKVTIPQFVASWIKYCKRTGVDLYHALEMGDLYFCNYANQKDDLKLKDFFEVEGNQELFARAWLDGYEVEEKRYLVKMKGEIEENVLTYGNNIFRYFFTRESTSEAVRIYHTRKELEESGFGWVFDCPGIEIEEVEE